MDNWSSFDITALRILMKSKPNEEIADVLDKSVIDVTNKIKEITGGISPYYLLKQKKKQKKIVKELNEVEKSRLDHKIMSAAAAVAKRQRNKPLFKLKQVDLSNKVAIRIDAKTTIFAEPGQNPEEIKKRYLDRLADSRKDPTSHRYVEVKKFKPLKKTA